MATAQDWFTLVVTAIGIPVASTLFWLQFQSRSKLYDLDLRHETLKSMVMERFQTAREERITQIATTKAELVQGLNDYRRASDMAIIALRDEQQEFKLRVYEDFVPYHALRATEERLTNVLEKLSGKIDKLGDRFDAK